MSERKPTSSATPRIWTASNIITIVRILLVPLFVAVLLAPWPEWFGLDAVFMNDWKEIFAAAVFVLISGTDWLDGYLARSRNEVTDFGKFMDPLADKILVAAALIALVELGNLPTWVVLIILAREFIVSGVRMMAATKGEVIAASMLGKFKTVFQMIAIVLFTIKDSHMIGDLGEALNDALWVVSWVVMLIALALTVASLIDYLVKGREVLGFGSSQAMSTVSGNVETAVVEKPECSALVSETAAELISRARKKKCTLACAESLTGGAIGSAITAVPGSSKVFKGGIISYVNEIKRDQLGVDAHVLEREGAVCAQVAAEMADGVRAKLDADIAVSVTGIAGPGGAEPGKPVGTVFMGLSTQQETLVEQFVFSGDRDSVREQTVAAALAALNSALTK